MPLTFSYADKALLKNVPTFKAAQPSASQLKLKGIQAISATDYMAAASYFRQALDQNTDPRQQTELQQSLLMALTVGGNAYVPIFPDRALILLRQAIALQPQNHFLYARLGDAFCQLHDARHCFAAHTLAMKFNPDKAEAIFNAALALGKVDPVRSARLYDIAANLYRQRGDMKGLEATLMSKAAYGL